MTRRVAVVGGTGVVGRLVVDQLQRQGAIGSVLARSTGVDVISGEGLQSAVAGADAIIDVSNIATNNAKKARAFFETATRNILQAGLAGGVRHHVALSIVGCDRVEFGYYHGKRRQEELVRTGPMPWTILRATQFHEFPGQLLDRFGGPIALAPRMRSQTVAAEEVAEELIRLALGGPAGYAPEIAGPEIHEMPDLVRQVISARGSRRLAVTVKIPGAGGRAMADGALLPTADGPRGEITFAEWLSNVRG